DVGPAPECRRVPLSEIGEDERLAEALARALAWGLAVVRRRWLGRPVGLGTGGAQEYPHRRLVHVLTPGDRLGYGALPVGLISPSFIPFTPHTPRLAEQAVHAVGIAPRPERQPPAQLQVALALAGVATQTAVPQLPEPLAVLGRHHLA